MLPMLRSILLALTVSTFLQNASVSCARCNDFSTNCIALASKGFCKSYPRLMAINCKRTCNKCGGSKYMKFSISCKPDLMTVKIDKRFAESLNVEDLHLKDKSCRATTTATHVIVKTRPDGCLTKVRTIGNAVQYSNIIFWRKKTRSGNVKIRRKRQFLTPITCILKTVSYGGVSSAFKPKINARKISVEENRMHNLLG